MLMGLRLWALFLSLTPMAGGLIPALAQIGAQTEAGGGVLVQVAPPPSPQAAGYPVTGRVTCADTQRAARFAQVTLIQATQATQSPGGGFRGGQRLSARTDLDGNFALPAVPPGDYYVTGFLTGYINTEMLVQAALNAGNDPGSALAGVPLIHVSAGGASAALSLQRGGVIAGIIQWDDGSPAAGVNVNAQPVPANGAAGAAATGLAQFPGGGRGFGGGFAGTQTDDLGRYRLSGLAPGGYYLRANVQAPAPPRADDRSFARILSLSVYAPDKLRRTDATPIALGAGEERADVNVVLGLAALHTVSGTVGSSAAAVRSGTVNLTDQTDSSLSRTGAIGADGSFVVPYVPSGTYTLRVNASAQAFSNGRGGGSSDSSVHFQPLQQTVTVADGDLSGLSVTVTAAAPSP